MKVMETVEIRVPRKPDFLLAVRLFVAGLANLLHFSMEEIEDIKLAVGEACYGPIRNECCKGPVIITCKTDPASLIIEVIDCKEAGMEASGIPFEEPVEQALGLVLMRSLMDKVEYVSDEKGTVIRMMKRTKILHTQ